MIAMSLYNDIMHDYYVNNFSKIDYTLQCFMITKFQSKLNITKMLNCTYKSFIYMFQL